MKFGVNLINFGPGANPESLTRSVNLVEAIGYHLIMSSRPHRRELISEVVEIEKAQATGRAYPPGITNRR